MTSETMGTRAVGTIGSESQRRWEPEAVGTRDNERQRQ